MNHTIVEIFKDSTVEFIQITHLSIEYWQWLRIREKVLRLPLGLRFSIEEIAKENDEVIFGVLHNSKIVGGLQLQIADNKAKMRQVAILPILQSKGLGKKLIYFCTDILKKNGVNLIYCNARKNAIPFYQSLGFQIKSDIFEEVGIAHVKMEKEI